jgi:hypothetical protein
MKERKGEGGEEKGPLRILKIRQRHVNKYT